MTTLMVLTGTTGFPLLEKHMVSMAAQVSELEILVQSPNSLSESRNLKYQKHIDLDNLDTSHIDVVIGHCGAGTVFWTLERDLPLIAIVDLTRPDGHQEDLGKWIGNNNYGLVLANRGPTIEEISLARGRGFATYKRVHFSVERIKTVLSEIK